MTPNTNASYHNHHGLPIEVKVAAWSLLLILCGYGLAETPELWLTFTKDPGASVPAVQTPVPVARTDVTAPALATQNLRALTFDERDDRSEAPRECFPEKGINNACIYN